MIKYTSQFQLKINSFGDLYPMKLNKNNRWVQLGNTLPWDKLVKIFRKHFSNYGRSAINPRIVIGALIIKHKMNFSDEKLSNLYQKTHICKYSWV